MKQLTPTQQKIYDLLADGNLHSREEVQRCLWDELSPLSAIPKHISMLREILNPGGLDISYSGRNGGGYRMVRMLNRE